MKFHVKTIFRTTLTIEAVSYEEALFSAKKDGTMDDEIESIRLDDKNLRYIRNMRKMP